MARPIDLVHVYIDREKHLGTVLTLLERSGRRAVAVAHAELGERLPEIEVLLCGSAPKIDWSGAARLRLLALMGSGVDALWPATGLREHILITNTRGIHAPEMRDHALALMLALERGLPTLIDQQRRGEWRAFTGGTLSGKTVAILGLGEVGRSLAAACAALGMRVVGTCARPRPMPHVDQVFGPDELEGALGLADHLVITLPLTATTRNTIDGEALEKLRPGAFLVQLSRGGIVDEVALEAALRAGAIRGAALDVFAEEPLPSSSSLWTTPNLIVSPHIAGWTSSYLERAVSVFLENLELVEGGLEPRTRVDRTRQY